MPNAVHSKSNRRPPHQPSEGETKAASSRVGSPVQIRPQRRLLVVFSVIFAIWVGALLVMYFKTVREPRLVKPTTGMINLPATPPADRLAV